MNNLDPEEKKPRETHEDFSTHRQLVFWLFSATAILAAVLTVLLLNIERGPSSFSILKLVVLVGALGAFVSALRRLYAFENIFPTQRFRDLLRQARLYVVIYSLIPPLIGAIAAAVLYVFFAAEIVKSPLFPAFDCELEGDGCRRFKQFIDHWKPNGPTDYAKAVVWGFVAGFSERVVPDILNRLVERSEARSARQSAVADADASR